MRTSNLLVLLCRPPESPESKTRLVADVGMAEARNVYRECLRRVVAAAGAVAGADLRIAVAGRPLDLVAYCTSSAPDAELVRQYGETFAQRQRNEIRRGLMQGYRRVAFMASDLPNVNAAQIGWALAGQQQQVRIVSSHDGGYSIFGSGADVPELGEVPMSRSDTLSRLVSALRGGGRHVRLADFTVPNINHGSDLRFLAGSGGEPRGADVRS